MKTENRLKKRKQFNWIFKNGKSVYSKDLVLVYTQSKTKACKVGFSVTKKVGKAVVRNKVKRRLKAIVSKHMATISNNFMMIFVAKPSIVDVPFLEVESQVLFLLKKAQSKKEI